MRMKIARALPLFLVLIITLTTAGRVLAEEVGVKIALTPEELLEKMAEAIRGVETFQVDREATKDAKAVIRGEAIEGSLLMQCAIQVDLINQRMMMTTTSKMTMPPMPGVPEKFTEMETKTEVYLVDGIMYIKVATLGMPHPTRWTKAESPWVSLLEQAIDVLKISQIDILRVEGVNGIESYVLKVVPDPGKFWEIMEAMTVPGMEPDPPAMDIDPEEMFPEITMQTWVCRDTFLSVKETMVFEGMEMKISTMSRYHSFNDPVTIQLPAEATEAKEMPEWCPPEGCP